MAKRFFYAATVDTDNFPEVRTSGVVDTKEPIDIERLTIIVARAIAEKGGLNPSVHILQLNFLMDIPDE